MPAISFGKRQRFADRATDTLPKRVVPAFDRSGFARRFADAAVRFNRKHGGIGVPEIAETGAGPIVLGNPMPEPPTRPYAVIANDTGDDLARPPTQDRPQPAFPRPLADKRPDFIDFQLVIRLRGRHGRP